MPVGSSRSSSCREALPAAASSTAWQTMAGTPSVLANQADSQYSAPRTSSLVARMAASEAELVSMMCPSRVSRF
ncbi:hypothetical protein D9M71_808620 [compost metagenome]